MRIGVKPVEQHLQLAFGERLPPQLGGKLRHFAALLQKKSPQLAGDVDVERLDTLEENGSRKSTSDSRNCF